MLYPDAARAVADSLGETKVFEPDFDLAASRAEERAAAASSTGPEMASVIDVDADGVGCRVYVPRSAEEGLRPGTLVHLHGGGFVFHDLDTHDAAARRLAERTGLSVVSVDYRRPPEHRFPAAPDDVDTVLGWLSEQGEAIGGGGPRYLHGDSAGANLALVAALRNPGLAAAVVLIYPFLDPQMAGESYREAAENGFDPREAAWYWAAYAGDAERSHPDLAPLVSDGIGDLPPLLVVTAEHDPLRSEGELLAARAAEAGVPVLASRQLGQIHGFWRHPDVFEAADAVLDLTAGFLRRH